MSDQNDKMKIVHVHLPKDEKFTTTLNAGRHELIGDEPESVEGGKDKGPDPYDYLLMALGSCTVMTIRMYADHKEWPVKDIYLELRHNKRHSEDCKKCDEKESRIDYIEKELIVKGDLTEKQLNRIREISERCPVNRTLRGEIEIKSSISQ